MLSDEEKKAIESLIEIREFANLSSYKDTKISQLNAIDVVLNLIEKQSKEIEELKEDNKKKSIVIIEYQDLYEKLVDKIKAKIEEIDKAYEDSKNEDGESEYYYPNYTVEVLQSLLEKE